MTQDDRIIKELERMDFAGTTLLNAVFMAAPYIVFLAVVFGTLDLVLDRIMPSRKGVVE